MSERAQRRRAMRDNGFRRAETKKGRRTNIRQAKLREAEDRLDALEASGFQVARMKLQVPHGR